MTFVDYKKVFHSVFTITVTNALEENGIGKGYMEIQFAVFDDLTAQIKVQRLSNKMDCQLHIEYIIK